MRARPSWDLVRRFAARAGRVRVIAVVVFALSLGGASGAPASGWSLQRVPDEATVLSAVSCVSPTACEAVGSYTVFGAQVTVAERWNGSSWSVQRTPSPGSLSGVSCVSSTACTAVGTSGGRALVLRWNGTSWVIQSTPTPSSGGVVRLVGVSCPSATVCIAIGAIVTGGGGGEGASIGGVPLVEQWNGAGWSILPTPGPLGFRGLSAVSCTSATACTAVGGEFVPEAGSFPLVERWNGASWSAGEAAVSGGPYGNCSGCSGANFSLNGVSCVSPALCAAVGSANNTSLAERWDGASWTIQPTPGTFAGLKDVSCASSVICTATGSDTNAPLVERWDGTSWTIQPNPASSGILNGVSCAPSTGECIAVGSSSGKALAERWDGTTWTLLATIAPTACVVPNVQHKSLTAARKLIRAAHCTVGKVSMPQRRGPKPGSHKRWKLVVGGESPSLGSVEPSGTSVRLKLVYKAVQA